LRCFFFGPLSLNLLYEDLFFKHIIFFHKDISFLSRFIFLSKKRFGKRYKIYAKVSSFSGLSIKRSQLKVGNSVKKSKGFLARFNFPESSWSPPPLGSYKRKFLRILLLFRFFPHYPSFFNFSFPWKRLSFSSLKEFYFLYTSLLFTTVRKVFFPSVAFASLYLVLFRFWLDPEMLSEEVASFYDSRAKWEFFIRNRCNRLLKRRIWRLYLRKEYVWERFFGRWPLMFKRLSHYKLIPGTKFFRGLTQKKAPKKLSVNLWFRSRAFKRKKASFSFFS